MTQVFQGQTVSKEYTFKDKGGALMDPDVVTVKIVDSSGAEVAPALSMVKVSDGVYELNFNVPSDGAKGNWIIFVTAVKGSYTEKKVDVFEVLLSK